MNQEFHQWLSAMPKAELHMHIDGSLQARRMLSLADENSVSLPYSSVEEIEAAYQFTDLQSFLDLYYLGASVLRKEQDFYLLMLDYLTKCREQHIVHTEIMIEPQTYAPHGVSMETVMTGFRQAIKEASEGWGQSVLLILSFLRHLSEREALDTLREAAPWRNDLMAIGLASSEQGNPPGKFKHLFATARSLGYRTVAHAGEEGPPAFIRDALNLLKVERIDHGIRCSQEPALVERLVRQRVPLTVCPLSNVRLRVFDRMQDHNILKLLEQDVMVTVNSDDPAYFGGYLNENFHALADSLSLTRPQALQLAENSFNASFLPDDEKKLFVASLHEYAAGSD